MRSVKQKSFLFYFLDFCARVLPVTHICDNLVCRVQDAEGRGPYRPGFSHIWNEHEDGPAPVMGAFPGAIAEAYKIIRKRGGAVGCAFRTVEQARAWFNANEVLTLARYGYSLCWMKADEVLAENNDQLVIWTKVPLAKAVIHKGWVKPEVV
jgi:hypothetical protein